jgi:hypothetical protein
VDREDVLDLAGGLGGIRGVECQLDRVRAAGGPVRVAVRARIRISLLLEFVSRWLWLTLTADCRLV